LDTLTIRLSSFESIPFDSFAAPFVLGGLFIKSNPDLHDVDGLASLLRVNRTIDIANNPKLRSVAGLCGLQAQVGSTSISFSNNGQLCSRDAQHIIHPIFGFKPSILAVTGADTSEQCQGYGCSCSNFPNANLEAQCTALTGVCVVRAGVHCYDACAPGQVFDELNMTCQGPVLSKCDGVGCLCVIPPATAAPAVMTASSVAALVRL